MSRRGRSSNIWFHFMESTKEKNVAKCLYCYRLISLSGGSSGNLYRHLRLKHPELSFNKNRKTPLSVQYPTKFTLDESVCLRSLLKNFAKDLRGNNGRIVRNVWETIAKEYNSTHVNSQRTIRQLKIFWKEEFAVEDIIKTEEDVSELNEYVEEEAVDPLPAPDQTNVIYIPVSEGAISEDEGVSTSESRTPNDSKLHDLRMTQCTELFEAEKSAAEQRYRLEKELLEKRFDLERQVHELRVQYYTRKMRMEEELHEIKMRIKRSELELLRSQVTNEADINDTGEVRNES